MLTDEVVLALVANINHLASVLIQVEARLASMEERMPIMSNAPRQPFDIQRWSCQYHLDLKTFYKRHGLKRGDYIVIHLANIGHLITYDKPDGSKEKDAYLLRWQIEQPYPPFDQLVQMVAAGTIATHGLGDKSLAKLRAMLDKDREVRMTE